MVKAFGITAGVLLLWVAAGYGVSLYRSRRWPTPDKRKSVLDIRD